MKSRMRWFGLIGVALVLGVLTWGGYQGRLSAGYRNALEAQYQRDFYDLINRVEQAQVTLGKSVVSGSAAHNASNLAEVWFQASSASDTVAHLPLKGVNMAATRKFLTQVGDYARTLSLKTARGDNLSKKETQQLSEFEAEMAKLARDLHSLENRLGIGEFRWASVIGTPGMISSIRTRTVQEDGPGNLRVFGDINQRLQQLPNLIYDGPFSDHIEEIKPRGLTGSMVNQNQAAEIARRFVNTQQGFVYRVTESRKRTAGRIPAYPFILESRNTPGRIFINVSEKGGHVIMMVNSRRVTSSSISPEAAMDRASRFLRENNYSDMIPTFAASLDNTRVITFVKREGNVVIYPDQVKVKVALDNGQITGFDATQYLVAHYDRDIPSPQLSQQEARARLSPMIKVENSRLALIPMDGGREVFVYEFRGTYNEDVYFIYINAKNGREENILKLIQTPNGELTM